MPRILCTLPHASGLINGIAFSPTEEGMLSDDDLDADVTANFLAIPGYQVVGAAPVALPAPELPRAPAPPPAKPKAKPAKAVVTEQPPTPSGGATPVSTDGASP